TRPSASWCCSISSLPGSACWSTRRTARPVCVCTRLRKLSGNGSRRSCSRAMAVNLPQLPQDLLTGLLQPVEALDHFRLRYALIGGVAAGYRSRPRFTQDLDFLLDIPQLVLPGLLEDLRRRGFAFDPEAAMREWTQQHLTVLSFGGVRIDWLK